MADPKWHLRVQPVLHKAVQCLAHILNSSKQLLDRLVEEKLLTSNKYEEVLTDLGRCSLDDVARQLLITLQRCPDSFDTFCSLLSEVDQGRSLYNLICINEVTRPRSAIEPCPPPNPPTYLQKRRPKTAFRAEQSQSVTQSMSASGQSCTGKIIGCIRKSA